MPRENQITSTFVALINLQLLCDWVNFNQLIFLKHGDVVFLLSFIEVKNTPES